MDSSILIAELDARLRGIDSLGRVVSARRLGELQDDILGKYETGLLDEDIYDTHIKYFDYNIPDDLPDAGSVVIIATPQPHSRLTFHPGGQPRSFIVPSNYSHAPDEPIRGILAGLVEKAGFGIRRAQLPLKLLAVRSGLARYGKNNIAYIDGMGSYLRLLAFYTDFPLEEGSWGDKMIADRCHDCTACVKKCPTGAIDPDRFQIRAEQCLTFLNEEEGDMPAGIDPSIHHCLIGCLYCQKFCPLNQEFDDYIEASSVFSSLETEQILNAESNDSVTPEILAKLDKPGLHYDIKIVARNLRLLLEN
jgi:epoxyqueuosine reductase